MLKKIYISLKKIRNAIRWFIQSRSIEIKLDNAKSLQNDIVLSEKEKIIIVVPHPDDELIGCFGVMRSFSKNTIVFYSGMTGKDKSEKNKMIRTNEIMALCKKMNVNYKKAEESFYSDLENILRDDNVKYVFAPSCADWHDEHRLVFKAVLDVKEKFDMKWELLCYNISVPIAQSHITNFYIMNRKQQKEKWELFKHIYVSQRFMPVSRYRAEENSFSLKGKRVSADVYMKITENVKICEVDNISDVGRYINDLKHVEKLSELLHSEIFSNTL